jgi:hypothetical protein
MKTSSFLRRSREADTNARRSVTARATMLAAVPRVLRWTARALGTGVATLMLPLCAHADTFSRVYYDARTDQLVVSMIFSGTNPKHTFTLRWGQCQDVNGSKLHELDAEVLDSQWQDEALRPFKKTVRFSLADIPCRPAKVTLRTAPRFIYTVLIPNAPKAIASTSSK